MWLYNIMGIYNSMSARGKVNRNFKSVYPKYDLLFSSSSTLQPGFVAEWDGFIKRILDLEGYSFIAHLKISGEEKDEIKAVLAAVPLTPFSISSCSFDEDAELSISADLPNINSDVRAKFKRHKISGYRYDNVQAKIMPASVKEKIILILREAREEDKKYYRKKLKRLYADSVTITVENASMAELESSLKDLDIKPSVSVVSGNKYNVSFSGSNECPFAAKIEPLKDFID
jgi:hypothetical protein